MTCPNLDIHPDVATALATDVPVVALESTVITHGLAAPYNLEIALEQEQILHNAGVQPATTAIIDGRVKVGLTGKELEFLAADNNKLYKASRRDIAALCARGLSGGTTVAASIMIAHMAGIPLLSTGGIGGVHRHAEETFDVSADLVELGRTPVAVVCAGPKSILDLPKTMEYLETQGVPILGYKTDCLPAFFSTQSDCGVDYTVDSPEDIASILATQNALNIGSGMLICNPLDSGLALPETEVEPVIEEAIFHARKQHIRGKALTPFLLQTLHQQHGGKLLQANLEILKNNAQLAARIAQALKL